MERETSVGSRGLHKRRMHRRHGLAAILTLMSLRGARHRIAALHRLFLRRHTIAIERIYPKQNRHDRDQNWLRKAHSFKGNRPESLRQGRRLKAFSWKDQSA
jgi:hypothetical protein